MTDDSIRTPAQVMRSMVAMFATGDLVELATTVHPDYLDHQGLRDGPMHGPDGFATVVATARSNWEVLDVVVEDLIEGDDRVAARLRWHGTRASGQVVERETVEIVRLEGGRAIEHWGGQSAGPDPS